MSQQSSPAAHTRHRHRRATLILAVLGFLAVGMGAGVGAARLFGPAQHPERMTTVRPTGAMPDVTTPTETTPAETLPAETTTSPSESRSRASAHARRTRVKSAPAPTRTAAGPATGHLDPAGWSSQKLAASLVMTGVKMGDAAAIRHAAGEGVGGIVLFGPSSPQLAQTLRIATAAAPRGRSPLVASDEEGGQVQRLSSLIYPLPPAEVMGRWSLDKITRTAHDYAVQMKALGVNVSLGPDADLAVPGHFIARSGRSFSADPRQVGADVTAWNDGLRAAGVLGVVKHWPGHGQATDTHVGSSLVPAWSVLQRRDLIPFKAAFAHHGEAVMVGHLQVPGLTEGSQPTSESRPALRALRGQAGTPVLIMTDDLSMAAASTTLGISPAQAAVRSLVAGADLAMVCWAPVDGVTSAVRQAIDDGRLPRNQAIASARRVLRAQTSLAASH